MYVYLFIYLYTYIYLFIYLFINLGLIEKHSKIKSTQVLSAKEI